MQDTDQRIASRVLEKNALFCCLTYGTTLRIGLKADRTSLRGTKQPFPGSGSLSKLRRRGIPATWAIFRHHGIPEIHPAFALLMFWGYLQYDLCRRYRMNHGGGGPGFETLPERLVTTGPFAYTRNPMYLGHLIFLIGLTLLLHSYFAVILTVGTAVWMHRRVLQDEERLRELFREPYEAYTFRVKRWIPALF